MGWNGSRRRRDRDSDHREAVDAREVGWIAGIDGKAVGEAVAAIIASYARASTLRPAREGKRRRGRTCEPRRVKGQRVEVGLGLLHMGLARGSFGIGLWPRAGPLTTQRV